MASTNVNISFFSSKPTTCSPGDMYFDGTDLVIIGPDGTPRPMATTASHNKTYPFKTVSEVVAWCPECTTEYKLPGVVEDYYCYHHMIPEDLHRLKPEEIRNPYDFIPIKKHQCLVFEIHTEVYSLY